jgi:uncharacterized protein (DUF362 family)
VLPDPHRVLVLRRSEPAEATAEIARVWSSVRDSSAALLFKPNLIRHRHASGGDYASVVTQPEVLELAWSVADALGLTGTRYVADAPQGDALFGELLRRTGLAQWATAREVQIIDLRRDRYEERNGVPVAHVPLPGDPLGAVKVNLGRLSAFYPDAARTYYGAGFDIADTNAHHRGETHEYLFSATALACGLIINLPKMKTHKKAGVTLSLKNLVGLNAHKNWLPHHSLGTPAQGGDAYPDSSARERFESRLLRHLKPLIGRSALLAAAAATLKPLAGRVLGDTRSVVRSGNWWGNDTLWRMILDLNRILLYARPDGTLADAPLRVAYSLVDGLVAGEGAGPESPDRVDAGILVAGTDFVAVDIVCATLMGFDYRKIPHLAHALEPHPLPLTRIAVDAIDVESNYEPWNRNLWEIDPATAFRFRPHFGWTGRIEREAQALVSPADAA